MKTTLPAAFLLLAAFGLSAAAKNAADPAAAERDSKLASLMGPFRFGMTLEAITDAVSHQLDKEYEERIAKAADPAQAERSRRRKKADLAMFSKTFVEFGSEKSAWDVSMLEGQFAHGSGESMIVSQGDSRRYLFLFEGKLWRVFVEQKPSGPEGERSFEEFCKALEDGYGKGAAAPGKVSWTVPGLQVEALDLRKDFGTFALVLWDPAVMKKVARAREASAAR